MAKRRTRPSSQYRYEHYDQDPTAARFLAGTPVVITGTLEGMNRGEAGEAADGIPCRALLSYARQGPLLSLPCLSVQARYHHSNLRSSGYRAVSPRLLPGQLSRVPVSDIIQDDNSAFGSSACRIARDGGQEPARDTVTGGNAP